MDFIKNFITSARLVEDKGQEVIFKLPEVEGYEEKFQELFYALDKYKNELGVSSYGVSDTSLEEVCTMYILLITILSCCIYHVSQKWWYRELWNLSQTKKSYFSWFFIFKK